MRNFGVSSQSERDGATHLDKDLYHNPETFTAGFWTGAVLASIGWCICTVLGLLLIGLFG